MSCPDVNASYLESIDPSIAKSMVHDIAMCQSVNTIAENVFGLFVVAALVYLFVKGMNA